MEKDLSYIIPPVDRDLLEQELNENTFLRKTKKGGNDIYIINEVTGPNVLKEIGRLREVTFTMADGGTGKSLDLDDYDMGDSAYQQLIVYSHEDREIIGGYRFIDCSKVKKEANGQWPLSTQHYFNFSKEFEEDYLPYTIELGRSWVQPNYQPSVNPRKGLFALDNIWDGLGAIVVMNPHIKYLFGKVTMYPTYNVEARDAVLTFLEDYFPDKKHLVTPKEPLEFKVNQELLEECNHQPYKEGVKKLGAFVRSKGEFIPPLINSYMGLTSTMKTFGTCVNREFGEVEETGILVTIQDVHEDKRKRHLSL